MGLDIASAEFLYSECQRGLKLGRLLVLGRQMAHLYHKDVIDRIEAWCGVRLEHGKPVDDFYRALGATEMTYLDYSDFEGATLVHDLNQPLPERYHEKFDTVIDGGTMEHVFHYPIALKSCMQAVTLGGSIILVTPATNMMGHGFYQFSPELFFRVFSQDNGYELGRILLWHANSWYQVPDPASMGGRAELRTSKWGELLVSARRTQIGEIFNSPPLQSDYVTEWPGNDELKRRSGLSLISRLAMATPHSIRRMVDPFIFPIRKSVHYPRIGSTLISKNGKTKPASQ
jgi:hypothetical protein